MFTKLLYVPAPHKSLDMLFLLMLSPWNNTITESQMSK
jgi:hypothetical protein